MGQAVRHNIRFLLNGETVELDRVSPTETLLDYLRLSCKLRGSKEGCGEGDCGACSVLVGKIVGDELVYESVNACIRFVGSLDSCHVVTIEHLRGSDGGLHPVQKAMIDFHGSQCGFCTPGFVMVCGCAIQSLQMLRLKRRCKAIFAVAPATKRSCVQRV
jgi:xanthine dehydrogenase small subunit